MALLLVGSHDFAGHASRFVDAEDFSAVHAASDAEAALAAVETNALAMIFFEAFSRVTDRLLILADHLLAPPSGSRPICLLVARRAAGRRWSEQTHPPLYVEISSQRSATPRPLDRLTVQAGRTATLEPCEPLPPPASGRVLVVEGTASVPTLQRRSHHVETTDDDAAGLARKLRHRAEVQLPDLVVLEVTSQAVGEGAVLGEAALALIAACLQRRVPLGVVLREEDLDLELWCLSQGASAVVTANTELDPAAVKELEFWIRRQPLERRCDAVRTPATEGRLRLLPSVSLVVWVAFPPLFSAQLALADSGGAEGELPTASCLLPPLAPASSVASTAARSGGGRDGCENDGTAADEYDDVRSVLLDGVGSSVGDGCLLGGKVRVGNALAHHAHGVVREAEWLHGGEGAVEASRATSPPQPGQRVVAKCIEKRLVCSSRAVGAVLRALHTMGRIGYNPNIVRLFRAFHTRSHLVLVLERAMGGSLRRFGGNIGESDVRPLFRQLVGVVEGLHTAFNVSHGAIEPRNVLLDCADQTSAQALCNTDIKLGHFARAHAYGCGDDGGGGLAPPPTIDEGALALQQGRPFCPWVAPEVWRASVVRSGGAAGGGGTAGVDPVAADVWSLGMTLLWMLSSDAPASVTRGLQACTRGDRRLGRDVIVRGGGGGEAFLSTYEDNLDVAVEGAIASKCLSPALADLLSGLLRVEPALRTTLDDLIVDPWVTGENKLVTDWAPEARAVPMAACVSRDRSKNFVRDLEADLERHRKEATFGQTQRLRPLALRRRFTIGPGLGHGLTSLTTSGPNIRNSAGIVVSGAGWGRGTLRRLSTISSDISTRARAGPLSLQKRHTDGGRKGQEFTALDEDVEPHSAPVDVPGETPGATAGVFAPANGGTEVKKVEATSEVAQQLTQQLTTVNSKGSCSVL